MPAKKRRSPRSAVEGDRPRQYTSSRSRGKSPQERRFAVNQYLTFAGTYPSKPLARPVETVQDAVRSIHDLLKIAAGARAEVAIICRSLSRELREELWTETAGCSFAAQIREILSAGGRVRILLHNRADDERL